LREARIDRQLEHRLVKRRVRRGEAQVRVRDRHDRLRTRLASRGRPRRRRQLREARERHRAHDLGLPAREVTVEHGLRVPDRVGQAP
jgi:hypothetical protein